MSITSISIALFNFTFHLSRLGYLLSLALLLPTSLSFSLTSFPLIEPVAPSSSWLTRASPSIETTTAAAATTSWTKLTSSAAAFSNIHGRQHALMMMNAGASSVANQAAESTSTAAIPKKGLKKELVGAKGFKRENPLSDRFDIIGFHHVEFYCGDATNTARRFMIGLGMPLVAKSDMSTGNNLHCSYVLQSNDLRFMFTAPYPKPTSLPTGKRNENADDVTADGDQISSNAMPGFEQSRAHDFFREHGLSGRAIGLHVKDANMAYSESTANGGIGILPPTVMMDGSGRGCATISEVVAYGDVVLRFISFGGMSKVGKSEAGEGGAQNEYSGCFLPNFEPVTGCTIESYGLQRLDHAVGNVWDLLEAVNYIGQSTGMHEFAEFVAEDVGTVDSGLNSVVMASNNEMVLLPLNEPTYGTNRKSQIQTYLEQHRGPGLQHLALKTDNIVTTLRKMRAMTPLGGLEFMDGQGEAYYKGLPKRIPSLTPQQLKEIEELGILADEDDQGILLQIFSKPVGDRATFFVEIIQRIGCMTEEEDGTVAQKGGCGGFGKGNFAALFKSIEDYEKSLEL